MEYNYTHGGDVYRNPIEYDFSINVNPLGMPLASIQAAHEGIVLTGRYPDYRAEQLCRAIAKAQNIPADRIIPGNGAAELLYALGQTIPGKALAIAPTFTGYAEAVAAGGGEMSYAGCEDADGGVDDMSGQDRLQFDSETVIQRLLAKLDDSIRLVFLCNPNNPTGTLFTREQILRVLAKAEAMQAYVCVDECFLPFLEEEASYSRRFTVWQDFDLGIWLAGIQSCSRGFVRSFSRGIHRFPHRWQASRHYRIQSIWRRHARICRRNARILCRGYVSWWRKCMMDMGISCYSAMNRT